MGENGRRAVIEKYNWKNEASELVSDVEGFIPNVKGTSPRRVLGGGCLCSSLQLGISAKLM